jgi:hypothetical protein
MAYTAKQLVKIAEAEIGYHEKASNSNLDSKTANSGNKNFTKYGRDLFKAGFFNGNKNGFDWCAQFPTWCVWKLTGKNKKKTEYILCVGGDLSAGCGFALKYYKQAGRFSHNPKVGDQIFFKYSNDDSTADHTGIVVGVTDSIIETIEGNSSNQVKRNTYQRNSKIIIGYGHPRYDAEPKKTVVTKGVKTVKIELSVLKNGSKGEEVKTLQRILRMRGWEDENGNALEIDGSFGAKTEYAVRAFQKGKGVGVDGIVGEKTWNKLLK